MFFFFLVYLFALDFLGFSLLAPENNIATILSIYALVRDIAIHPFVISADSKPNLATTTATATTKNTTLPIQHHGSSSDFCL